MPPIIEAIQDAKAKFLAQYNFPAECIHVTVPMEKLLHRWAEKHLDLSTSMEAEVAGLAVVQSTKSSPHVEFWLSALRNSRVFVQHARLDPEEMGASVIRLPGETIIGDE